MHPDTTSMCRAVFLAWAVLGALLLAAFRAWEAITIAGPLAVWFVAIPLACLVAIEPCGLCAAVARRLTIRARMPAPARRLRGIAA